MLAAGGRLTGRLYRQRACAWQLRSIRGMLGGKVAEKLMEVKKTAAGHDSRQPRREYAFPEQEMGPPAARASAPLAAEYGRKRLVFSGGRLGKPPPSSPLDKMHTGALHPVPMGTVYHRLSPSPPCASPQIDQALPFPGYHQASRLPRSSG